MRQIFSAFSIGIFLLFLKAPVTSSFIKQLQSASTNLSLAAKNRQSVDFLKNVIEGIRSALTIILDGDITPESLETLPVYYKEHNGFIQDTLRFSQLLSLKSELQDEFDKNHTKRNQA